MAISAADRRLLIIAGAVFALLLCCVALLTPQERGNEDGVPSTYSAAPGGARAAFLLLRELGLPVERWESSPVDLPLDSSGAVLVLANPAGSPTKREQESLENFVRSGGRILFTGLRIKDFFPEARLISESPGLIPRAVPPTFSALFPSVYTRHADTVTFRPEAFWNGVEAGQLPLYGDWQKPAAISWRMGSGRIQWWAGPTPLTNAYISKEENLNLFLNAVGASSNPSAVPERICWDEYFHGERASLWNYAADTPLAWGLLQLGILGAAVLFTFSRRTGPLSPAPATPRLWPLEFVNTLGALYERAGATSAAVDAAYRNCRAVLGARLKLPPTISDAALGQAVENRLGWSHTDLARTLSRAAAAGRGEKVSPADALELVQELEYCRQQVEFKRTQEMRRP